METLLISKSDVSNYRQISARYDTARFNAFAQNAQNINLRELLHDNLYYDLITNYTETKYSELINGKEYLYNKETIKFYGLKPYLCYHWLAYATREGDAFLAVQGSVKYSNNPQHQFEPTTNKKALVQTYLENTTRYANDIIQFLDQNISTYPLWDGGKDEKRTAFNIITV